MGYADIGYARIGHAHVCRVWLYAVGAFALFSFAVLAPSASAARDTVHLSGYSAGTIVVKTSQRRLYYFVDGDTAIQYPVSASAKQGWPGRERLTSKAST